MAPRVVGKLFDSGGKPTAAPKGFTEPSYRHLARTTRPSLVLVREVLEEWFSCYPVHDADDLRARFRSDRDLQHVSAYSELWLHQLLLGSGCSVTAVHPQLIHNGTRPDFLAISPSGDHFYVEATISSSRFPMPDTTRIQPVLDAISALDSPDFFVNIVGQKGAPRTPPPIRQLRAILLRWLSSLDHEACLAVYECHEWDQLPVIRWAWDGWEVEFAAQPKRNLRGSAGVRTLGISGVYAGFAASADTLRDRVCAKAKRYGRLKSPYVLFVNALDMFLDLDDVKEALIGDRDGAMPVSERVANEREAVWFKRNRCRNDQLSAVLVGKQILPSYPTGDFTVFVASPHPSKAVPGGLFRLDSLIVHGDCLRMQPGASSAGILGLPEDWPHYADA